MPYLSYLVVSSFHHFAINSNCKPILLKTTKLYFFYNHIKKKNSRKKPLSINMSGTQNDNPGNFANRPTEEVQAIASKGGQASHSGAESNPGNFANR